MIVKLMCEPPGEGRGLQEIGSQADSDDVTAAPVTAKPAIPAGERRAGASRTGRIP